MDTIRIRGARTHNLKNINVDLPRDALIVITGLSGCGKSSLAFDTLFAEGQRRYVESLSAYARQFLSVMDKPDVDTIDGLSPAIAIEQKSTSHNPRSTVGTITEVYDYLRLLFARAVFSTRFACSQCGYSMAELEPRAFSFNSPHGACAHCDGLGVSQFFDEKRIITNSEVSLAGGAVRGWDKQNPYYFQMVQSLARHYGFDVRTIFNELPKDIQNVVLYGSNGEEIKFTYQSEKGQASRESVRAFEGVIPNLQRRYKETESNAVREELAKLLSSETCPECKGARLNQAARHVLVGGHSLSSIVALSIGESSELISNLKLKGQRAEVASKITSESH